MIYHISLGANIGNPPAQIQQAAKALNTDPDISINKASSISISAAYGKTDQPDFYNQILEIESSLAPNALLERLLAIEDKMGRVRKEKWGPRNIDLDILLAGDMVMGYNGCTNHHTTKDLMIPHPDFHNRLYALQLLMEIIPDAVHPVLHLAINELYYNLLHKGDMQ